MINPRIIALLAMLATAEQAVAKDSPSATGQPGKAPAVRAHKPGHFGDNRPFTWPAVTQFGDHLNGLTAEQINLFLDGKDDFEKAESVEGGLGPIFNRDSCVACHSSPVTGGGSSVNVTRFGVTVHGKFDPLDSLGGSLLQENSIVPEAQEFVPAIANVVIHRNSTPLFGLGLMEAIPDAEIVRNARQYGNEQIHGRVGWVTDIVSGKRMAGRFGWKAQQATITAFAADAYRNEMGVTNKYFPTENAPNGNQELLKKFDFVQDPEDQATATSIADFEKVANFMKFLAAPPVNKPTPTTAAGQLIFNNLGCALCHTPVMHTGYSSIAALNNKDVRLFSDLLLHDMGSLGDGIVQETATGREFRTPPLWGISQSAPYLHDGRALTIDEAIKAHEGEGKVVKDRYLKLNKAQQKLLTDFVLSL
jgi:CxxC motif-containing protein (DUF1111 family)